MHMSKATRVAVSVARTRTETFDAKSVHCELLLMSRGTDGDIVSVASIENNIVAERGNATTHNNVRIGGTGPMRNNKGFIVCRCAMYFKRDMLRVFAILL